MRRTSNAILTALVSAVCLLAGAVQVNAAGLYSSLGLDEAQDCTVTVILEDGNPYEHKETTPIEGAEISMVKAASLNPDGTYALEEAFQSLSGTDWDRFLAEDDAAAGASAADKAWKIVSNEQIEADAADVTDQQGKAELHAGNDFGIYLLYQSGRRPESTACIYSEMTPVLAFIPLMQTGKDGAAGQWVTNQTMLPKMLENNGTHIKVKKRALDEKGNLTDKKVTGAGLQILDGQGQVLENWVTTDVDHDTGLLKPGQYTLHELEAPSGYLKADDITFVVKTDGTLVVDGSAQDDNSIVMGDPVSPRETTTVQTTAPESRTTVVVSTGDRLNAGLWALIAIAAACAILFALIMRGKKNGEGQPR